jgi:hypothetical protein
MPQYISDTSKSAIDRASAIAEQPYRGYDQPRVASLSDPQKKAVQAGEEQIGKYQPAFAEAEQTLGSARQRAQATEGELSGIRDRTRESTQRQFTDEVSKYMSPYVEQAIEPTLRELREQNAQMTNQQRAEMVRGGGRGSFGGARAAIMDAEQAQRTQQTMSDVLKEGYQSAFEQAGDLFAQDVGLQREGLAQQADLTAQQMEGAKLEGAMAEQRGRLAGQEATVDRSGIQAAMEAGEMPRRVEQASMDVAYEDFLEQRDWNQRGLDAYLRALRGTPYEETTTQQQVREPSTGQQIGQLTGAVTAGIGAYNTFF